MALFKFDEAAAGQNGGGKGFRSGVTLATINGLFTGVSKAGNDIIDIHVTNEAGGKAIVFEVIATPTTKTGKNNPFYASLMELAYFAGVREGTAGQAMKKIAGVDTPTACLAEATGKKLMIGLQRIYDVNPMNNKEKIFWSLNKTFSATGQNIASAREGIERNDSESYTISDYETPAYKAAVAAGTLIKEDGTAAGAPAAPADAPAPAQGKLF